MPEHQQSFDLGIPKEQPKPPTKPPKETRRRRREEDEPQHIIAVKSPVFNPDEIKEKSGTRQEDAIKRMGLVDGKRGYLVDPQGRLLLFSGGDKKPKDSGFVLIRTLEDLPLIDYENNSVTVPKGMVVCTYPEIGRAHV